MNASFSIIPLDEQGNPEPLSKTNILNLIKKDSSLPESKKRPLLAMLNSPEVFDHLFFGLAGAAITRAITHYSSASKPARTLLSLAGFGIGNILYNYLMERKHTTYNPHTGKTTVLL